MTSKLEKKIIRNRIRCKHCGDPIKSKTTHDFQLCTCEAVGIDGVLDYPKRIFASYQEEEHYEELSESESREKELLQSGFHLCTN